MNTKLRGRFEVQAGSDDKWEVVDNSNGFLVGFPTKAEATKAATFARRYVRRHGDINFGSFPYTLAEPLRPFCGECCREAGTRGGDHEPSCSRWVRPADWD